MDAPRQPRYESLDVWRGVACLAVVVFHAVTGYVGTPQLDARVRAEDGSAADWAVVAADRLWVGVPLFFVVSGYCIAAAADSARRKPLAGATFFVRRFRRIYPPLWAFLAVAAATFAFLPPAALPGPTVGYPRPIPYPQDVSVWQWVGSVTLTEEWRHYVAGPPRGYFTGQIWTLCYEEQFYAVVGLIVFAARRWLFPAVAVVTAVVFANSTDLGSVSALVGTDLSAYQRPLPGCFFDGLWLTFAAGVAVYYRVNYATRVVRWCLDGMLAAGVLYAVTLIPSAWEFRPTVPGYLLIGFAFALVLGLMHRADAALAEARVTAPLRFCGRMCYSLYLVHAPVSAVLSWNLVRAGIDTPAACLLVTVPGVVTASVGLSYVFHVLVERRFLNAPAAGARAPRAAGTERPPIESARQPRPALQEAERPLPV